MKTRAIFLVLYMLLQWSTTSYAQDGSKVIDDRNINVSLLNSLFLNRLNELRTQQGLNKLGNDSILTLAATDQAKYMSKIGQVLHTQDIRNKENPTARVVYYKGTNDRVGENCIQIILHKKYKDKKGKEITVNTYDEAADALFTGWKNSKPHYHNMITPYYDVQGIGFCYDPKTNKFYSSEVFATEAYIPPKDFKVVSDAWGITAGTNFYANLFSNELANFVQIRGDSIFLYYSLLNYFRQFVKNNDDGIAIDIVAREQFNCNHNNNLHGSPIFDGWMLEPVYYKKLMRGNLYDEKTNELLTYIGKTPEILHGREIQENVILIQGKHNAGYSFPITVEENNLPMLRLDTYWDTIQSRSKAADTFKVSINHYVEFK
ncbi:MAG TPA: CAP domain-containing protein, partial [Bacteroidia bacterium]|nr:CAP domain-containing protein [Bacteroidia bacterium]